MNSWEEALECIIALGQPLPAISIPLSQAIGRYAAENIIAKRTQPAVDLSAMDGYAIRFVDAKKPLKVIGESKAGLPFDKIMQPEQAVRIFTGAHVPEGADTILVQEDACIQSGILKLAGDGPGQIGKHIRKTGTDFCINDILLSKGHRIIPGAIAAAAMGNCADIFVHDAPKISIIASGDELVIPGTQMSTNQIPSSNNMMISAMLTPLACKVTDHGIAKDSLEQLKEMLLKCCDSDIIVTSGGASVGDHDLVQQALVALGADISFWRVPVRPGKPLMAGRLGKSIVLGLPGNPSSAFVTATLFLLPLVRHLSGAANPEPQIRSARSLQELPAGDNRTEFVRAVVDKDGIRTFDRQDSGLTTPLVAANALLIRPAYTSYCKVGDHQNYIIISLF